MHLDILPVQLGNVHPLGETSMVPTVRGAKSTDAIVVFVQVNCYCLFCCGRALRDHCIMAVTIHRVSKNVPHLACYNFDARGF